MKMIESLQKKVKFVDGLGIINRFIGIDGVYYIKEYLRENPDSDLFKKMTFETRIKGVGPIYHEVMGLEPIKNKKTNFELFDKKYPVGTIVEGEIANKNEYSLFVKIKDLDIDNSKRETRTPLIA